MPRNPAWRKAILGILDGMGYFQPDHRGVEFAGTDKPWLLTSGCRELLRCELPLIDDKAGQEPGVYTVRLGFRAVPGDEPGQRVFDVKLQDRVKERMLPESPFRSLTRLLTSA